MRIRHATSIKDGIIFHSNLLPGAGVKVFYDAEGNLKGKVYEEVHIEEDESKEKSVKTKSIILNVILICLGLISRNIYFVYAATFFSWVGSKSFFILLEGALDFKKKDTRGFSRAKFHAAEHMAINAYNRLGRVPTCEEIEEESFIFEMCGSIAFIRKVESALLVALNSIAIGIYDIVISNNVFIFAIICGTVFIVIGNLISKKKFFLQIERVLLSKPTEKEILLAQEGVLRWEIMEKSFDLFQKLNLR